MTDKNIKKEHTPKVPVIRKFSPGDYEAVVGLWREAGLPFKPKGRDKKENILKEITADTADFLLAELDGVLVGTVLATHDGRKGWINRLAVVPGHRHRGIARLLLKKAEECLHNKGLGIIACLIEEYNDVSMDFCQKAGYVKRPDIFYFVKRQYEDV